jgi:hypothetical protein
VVSIVFEKASRTTAIAVASNQPVSPRGRPITRSDEVPVSRAASSFISSTRAVLSSTISPSPSERRIASSRSRSAARADSDRWRSVS